MHFGMHLLGRSSVRRTPQTIGMDRQNTYINTSLFMEKFNIAQHPLPSCAAGYGDQAKRFSVKAIFKRNSFGPLSDSRVTTLDENHIFSALPLYQCASLPSKPGPIP